MNQQLIKGYAEDVSLTPTFIPSPRMTIATAVLQGMMAGGADKSNSISYLVERSIAYADEMLKQLSNYHELAKHQASDRG